MEELLETRIPLALAGAADKPWVETDPGQAWSKLLWADPQTGGWASLIRWKKGFVAGPHVHISDAHFIMLSGRIQVRDGVYGPGDYGHEPAGAVHEATTTLEDCIYFFMSTGRVRIDADPVAGTPAYEVGGAELFAAYEQARAQLTADAPAAA